MLIHSNDTNNSGQSLVEIVVAVAAGFLLISGAVVLIAVTLRTSLQNKLLQPANFLAKDLTDKLVSYAESRWYCPSSCYTSDGVTPANYGLYNLSKGSVNPYHLDTSKSPFQWASSIEGINNYTRHFYLENICRNSTGDITGISDGGGTLQTCPNAGDSEDPSTQKVVVVVSWAQTSQDGEVRIERYVTRSRRNQVFVQTDWSGGGNQFNEWDDESKFATSNNIDYGGTPGSLKVQP